MRSGTSIPVVSAGAGVCLIALLMAGSSAPATAETKPAIAVTAVFYGDKRVPVSWTCGRDFTADARRLCVPATREPGSWSVAGRVMDQDTLEPIADAKVRLFGRVVDPRRGRLRLKMVARTNHRGDYAFAAIPALLPGTTVTGSHHRARIRPLPQFQPQVPRHRRRRSRRRVRRQHSDV